MMIMLVIVWHRRKDFFYPPFVTLGLWILYVALYNLCYADVSKLHSNVYMYILLYCLSFAFTSFLIMPNPVRERSYFNFQAEGKKLYSINYLVIFCIIINALLIVCLFRLGGGGSLSGAITTIRNDVKSYSFGMKILIVLYNLTPLIVCYIMAYKVRVSKSAYYLLIFEMFMVAILFATKGRLIRFFSIIVLLTIFSNKKATKIKAAIVIAIGTVLLVWFTVLRDQSFFANYSLSDYGFLYIFSPLPSLDKLLNGGVPYSSGSFGSITFGFLYEKLSSLFGFQYSNYSISNYVQVTNGHISLTTNVFTLIGPYYVDFGFVGAIVCGVIYSLIFTIAYKKMAIKNDRAMAIFFLLNFPYLLLQFFGDFVLPTFSMTIQELVCSYLIIYFIRNEYRIPKIVLKRNR